MFFKKFKKQISCLLLCLMLPFRAFAYSDYIIPGGENIGIQLQAKGVMIVGTYKVGNISPSTEAGLKQGDMIMKVNEEQTLTIDQMVSKIDTAQNKDEIRITYMREGLQKETSLKLYKVDDIYKTGLYVKDGITGVGTLTFIDPESKLFGALGHEITEKSTGKILEIKDGKIFNSSVTGVEASTDGSPGEKNAQLDTEAVKGTVSKNTTEGVFGTYTEALPTKKKYKVAQKSEVKTGEATILTVTSGKEIKEYKINITKINDLSKKNKNFVFEITDTALLSQTGGIVQGMSGSPIIQGDYIVGAVTHVVVDNPAKGYGIFITNMLEEAENKKE
ncbi:MAG: SpoIVB peptidase [Bacilli bacterium]|nr:SpoIVB peptidase [Bacilli bacterium]